MLPDGDASWAFRRIRLVRSIPCAKPSICSNPDQPIVVNYCDFSCYWNWHHFRRFVREVGCVGAIPAYKGFHPHLLGNTHYAYLRETIGWVEDIQEKEPYTDDRMQEFASSGTYYFASARIMCAAFRTVVEQDLRTGGEYYVSLAYKPLLAERKPVAVYPLQHFMQWGTRRMSPNTGLGRELSEASRRRPAPLGFGQVAR